MSVKFISIFSLLVIVFLYGSLSSATAATYTVTSNSGSSNAGTLGWAIAQANATADADTIAFNLPAGQTLIKPIDPYPALSSNVVIDGTTQPGYAGTPLIEIDGSLVTFGLIGFRMEGNNITVKGLSITRFPLYGVRVRAGFSNTVIESCYLGVRPDGATAAPNGDGINVENASTIIGGNTAAQGNVISGNSFNGIQLANTSSPVQILNNRIGTNAAGTAALSNNGAGIYVPSPNNQIRNNLISGNAQNGVIITGATATGNVLTGNQIGTDAAGNTAIPNAQNGVLITNGATNNTVGNVSAPNTISGNTLNGVLVQSNGNTIRPGLYGLNSAGTAAVGNGASGVKIENASNNRIGDPTLCDILETLSGNGRYGIELVGANNNTINCNTVGMSRDRSVVIPNALGGILLSDSDTNQMRDNWVAGNTGNGLTIADGSTGNTLITNRFGETNAPNTIDGIAIIDSPANNIGSGFTLNVNVLVANGRHGLSITGAAATGNVIFTNYIGTADTNNPKPNAGNGIHIDNAPNNSITDNLISGNSGYGVRIQGAVSTGNQIASNRIGSNNSGSGALANSLSGVSLASGATANVIGPGNTISGNSQNGVLIESANNFVRGNKIGIQTASQEFGFMGNGLDGVKILAASGNTIGGTNTSQGNIISSNGGHGIEILNSANATVIQNNYIGTNIGGYRAVQNSGAGIRVFDALDTQIGTPGAGNVISGNISNPGIDLTGGNGTKIQGNFIGLNASGNGGIRNQYGIYTVASNFTIGGRNPGEGNVVSGNLRSGIEVRAFCNVTIEGNLVGTSADGNTDIGNGFNGIFIYGPSTTALVGGSQPGARNIVSGNDLRGINIQDGVSNARIFGNYIGTNAAGSAALPNSLQGIYLYQNLGGAIGGSNAGEGNVISGNLREGIVLVDNSDNNTIRGNLIGVAADGVTPLGNNLAGIRFVDLAAGSFPDNNAVGGINPGEANVIANNGSHGVVSTSGSGNAIRGNSIYSNAGLGIDLGDNGVTANGAFPRTGPNNLQNFPVISSVLPGSTVVNGTFNSAPNAVFTLDFYTNPSADGTGYGEGKTYLGSASVTTDANGNAVLNQTFPTDLPNGHFVSVTATDAAGNTSEFSLARNAVPTASSVLVGGRATTAEGRGINRARVTMTAPNGESRTVLTNVLGYYRFADVPAGETYIFEISHKQFQFDQTTQAHFIAEERSDINFTALPDGLNEKNRETGLFFDWAQNMIDTDGDGRADFNVWQPLFTNPKNNR